MLLTAQLMPKLVLLRCIWVEAGAELGAVGLSLVELDITYILKKSFSGFVLVPQALVRIVWKPFSQSVSHLANQTVYWIDWDQSLTLIGIESKAVNKILGRRFYDPTDAMERSYLRLCLGGSLILIRQIDLQVQLVASEAYRLVSKLYRLVWSNVRAADLLLLALT